MANAILKTMDFEESAALEAITYTCMYYPRFLIKNTYIYSYIHSYMLNYSVAALIIYSVRTCMQLLTYVHSCIVTFHVCDRMAAENIQAALGMNTTQLNLNLP